jgi:flavin reductase (DIM6/NTAB) family NADH-FMN oxidoreductase RutF/DNA-binding IclR family transcriptional regulator
VSIDGKRFRQVLGHFPTGVAVITAMGPDGKPAGMAVGSFTSVSLDPPLVAFLPDKSSSSWPKIEASGSFCVNILGAEQESVCRAFAMKGGDKFAELSWRPAGSGAPMLDGVLAWIDCDIDVVHEAGDHWIVVGRVRELDIANPSLPLVFFQGGYGRFSSLSLAAWESDLALQMRSADLARPEMEALAEDLDVECVASAVVGDEMALIARAGSTQSRMLPTQVGQRIPFEPPLGTAFVAWAPPQAQQAWLDRLGKDPDPDTVAALRATLDVVRRRGFSVGRGHTWHEEVSHVLARARPESPSAETHEAIHRLIQMLPPDYESPDALDSLDEIRTLSTPVFGPSGGVVMVLSLTVSSKRSLAAELEGCAARLREAAEAVTKALGGQPPADANER